MKPKDFFIYFLFIVNSQVTTAYVPCFTVYVCHIYLNKLVPIDSYFYLFFKIFTESFLLPDFQYVQALWGCLYDSRGKTYTCHLIAESAMFKIGRAHV